MKENLLNKLCEILIEFLNSKLNFDNAFREWQKEGLFDFALLDSLEINLYHLKNKSHSALRHTSENNSGFLEKADLFDLMVGSIFHEALHLKEYVYTLKSYEPRYESLAQREKGGKIDAYSSDFLKHSMAIVGEARANLPRKAYEVKNLFEDSLVLLEDIIKKYRYNSKIKRTIYVSRELIQKVYGNDGLDDLYKRIYKNGPPEGYYNAGLSFLKEGFNEHALEAFGKASESFPNSGADPALLGEMAKRCRLIKKKQPSLGKRADELIAKMR